MFFKAIEWATEREVDIMSISITTNLEKGKNDTDIERITAAIADAQSNHIIVFCTFPDRLPSPIDNFYPCSLPQVIVVGAATAQGKAAANVDEDDASFLLPGVNISTSKKSVSQTGSSIATALAAGLGGLLLHIATEAAPHHPLLKKSGRIAAMKKALQGLCSSNDAKYIRVADSMLKGITATEDPAWTEQAKAVMDRLS